MSSSFVMRESMTSSERNEQEPEKRADGNILPLIDVLDRLAGGASLDEVITATSLSESDIRTCFKHAAENLRQSKREMLAKRPILDWREVTIAETLEILANYAVKPNKIE